MRKQTLKFLQYQYENELKLKEQDQEVLEEELMKNEEYIARQEKLFHRIQEVTNVRNIQEMLSHLKYLQETQKNLEKQYQDLQKQIREKKDEVQKSRIELCQISNKINTKEKSQLLKLKLQEKSDQITQTTKVNKSEVKLSQDIQLEINLAQKNRYLDDKEALNERIEEMMAAATSCISRLIYQLKDGQENVQIKPTNICDRLSEVGLRLERMLFAINRNNQVFRNESINTEFVHIRPPGYMNLNEKYFNQVGNDLEWYNKKLHTMDLNQDEEFQQLLMNKQKIKEKNKTQLSRIIES